MSISNIGLFVAGDNSIGQLWDKNLQVSPIFVEAKSYYFEEKIHEVTGISAFNQSIAISFNDLEIIFKQESNDIMKFTPGIVKKIYCFENTVYALLFDGKIIDCVNNIYFPGEDYISFSIYSKFKGALDKYGNVYLFN